MNVSINTYSLNKRTQHSTSLQKKNKISFKGVVDPRTLQQISQSFSPHLAEQMISSSKGFNALYKALDKLNPYSISNHFATRLGIPTDFKGNKIVAGCSGLAANIFQSLGMKLPTGIFVEDLRPLMGDAIGVCFTSMPSGLRNYTRQVYGKDFNVRNVVFNQHYDWDNLQHKMINGKANKHFSTGHFLHAFIHEFVHNAHADHIYQKYGHPGANNLGYKSVTSQQGLSIIDNFRNMTIFDKVREAPMSDAQKRLILEETSGYGTTNFVETVAEEVTEIIVDSLDGQTIMPKHDPFFFAKYTEPKSVADMLDNAWNGNFRNIR